MPQRDQTPETGSQRLLAVQAGMLPAAAQLAAGQSPGTVAKDLVRDTTINALLGPAAAFSGIMIGVLKTMGAIARETQVVEKGLKNIAQLQQIEGKFETLLKSATLAKRRIEELYKFTASSPFRMTEVAEGNRLLQALTKGALSGARGMKLVGDAAAATGQDFDSAAHSIGRAYAAIASGRSLDRIMFTLTQTGVVTDELARKMEELEATGAGASAKLAEFTKHLERMSGGMQNEMRTLDAFTRKAQELEKVMQTAIAQPFVNQQMKTLNTTMKATENLTPVFAKMAEDVAPLMNFIPSLKNSIAETTFATKGFASALGSVWEAGKAVFGGMAVAGLASLTSGLGKASVFAARVYGTRNAQTLANTKFRIQDQTASGLVGQAKESASIGTYDGYATAAALLADAAALKTKTVARRAHTAAEIVARDAGGKLNAVTYAGAMALQASAGAWALLKRSVAGITGLIGGLVRVAAMNPFVWIAGAILAYFNLTKSINNAAEAQRKMSDEIAETAKSARDLVKNIKTYEDWSAAVVTLTDNLAEARKETARLIAEDLKSKSGLRGAIEDGFSDPLRERLGVTTNKEAREKGIQMSRSREAMFRGSRDEALRRRETIEFTDNEKQNFTQRLETADQKIRQNFDAQMAQSDDEGKVRLLQNRIKVLEAEAELGTGEIAARAAYDGSAIGGALAMQYDTAATESKAEQEKLGEELKAMGFSPEDVEQIRSGKMSVGNRAGKSGSQSYTMTGGYQVSRQYSQGEVPADAAGVAERLTKEAEFQRAAEEEAAKVRLGSASKLVQLQQQFNDLSKAPVVDAIKRKEIQEQILALQSLVSTAQSNELEANQKKNELAVLQRQIDLSKTQLTVETRLSAARKAGLDTATMEMEGQLVILQKQLDLANQLSNTQEAAGIKLQMSEVAGKLALVDDELAVEEKIARLRKEGLSTASLELQKQLDILLKQQAVANGPGGSPRTARQIGVQIEGLVGQQRDQRSGLARADDDNRSRLAGDTTAITRREDADRLRSSVAAATSSGLTASQALESEKLRIQAEAAEEDRTNPITEDPKDGPYARIKADEKRKARADAVTGRLAALDEEFSSKGMAGTKVVDAEAEAFNARRSAHLAKLTGAAKTAVAGGDQKDPSGPIDNASKQLTHLANMENYLKTVVEKMGAGLTIQ